MSDPGKVMGEHMRIKAESHAGAPSAQRLCLGCHKRRSTMTQFAGDSKVCKQCVRRKITITKGI